MKISTILNLFERISSIVYHMTDFRSAASIINSDTLKDTVKGGEIKRHYGNIPIDHIK